MAPGKSQTDPEKVRTNPEKVRFGITQKTLETRMNKGFTDDPRARARKNKKNKRKT